MFIGLQFSVITHKYAAGISILSNALPYMKKISSEEHDAGMVFLGIVHSFNKDIKKGTDTI